MSSFTEQLSSMGRAITGATFLLRTSEPAVRHRTLKKMGRESENITAQTEALRQEKSMAKKGSVQAENANTELGKKLEAQKDLRERIANMDASPENIKASREASLAYAGWKREMQIHLNMSNADKLSWAKRKAEYMAFLQMPISGGPSVETAIKDKKKRKELYEMYKKGENVNASKTS